MAETLTEAQENDLDLQAQRFRDIFSELSHTYELRLATKAARRELADIQAEKDKIGADTEQAVRRRDEALAVAKQAEADRDEIREVCATAIQNSRAEAEATKTATAELQAQYDQLKAAFQQFQKDHGLTAVQ